MDSDTLTSALEVLTVRVPVRRGLGGAVSCGSHVIHLVVYLVGMVAFV